MNDLAVKIEALLFVAEKPLTIKHLENILDVDKKVIIEALDELEVALKYRGINISSHEDGYRLVSAPDTAKVVRLLLEAQAKTELSKPTLETLSIIADRGPITRSGIESIRGVGSDATIKALLGRELILISGHSPEPGRPPLYTVSTQFLDLFGYTKLDQLPKLGKQEDAIK